MLKANKDSRVAIDYHNCLEVQEHIPAKNLAALEGLKANGCQVFLVFFGGEERKQMVRKDLTKKPNSPLVG